MISRALKSLGECYEMASVCVNAGVCVNEGVCESAGVCFLTHRRHMCSKENARNLRACVHIMDWSLLHHPH